MNDHTALRVNNSNLKKNRQNEKRCKMGLWAELSANLTLCAKSQLNALRPCHDTRMCYINF